MMELIPAIDVLGGKVVRLHQGRYDEVTVYAEDPVAQAEAFAAAGARSLHVVDLDGARDGVPTNVDVIERIVTRVAMRVQVGGGIRTADIAERWYDAGVARVVLGTVAVEDPAMVRDLAAKRPDGVVVALDARNGEVAVRGWLEGGGRQVGELAQEMDAAGVAAVLYTNILRDGTSGGPDVEGTASLQADIRATVIASGGIGSLDHLTALDKAGVRAAVCGRALYGGAFTLAQAFARLGSK